MPQEKGSEVEKFFEGLPEEEKPEADIFSDTPAAPEKEKENDGTTTPEKDGEPRKNRRHRRLEQQLTEEREKRIAAEARAGGISEAQKFVQTTGDDTPAKWLQMYGDTPESRQAWALQKEIMADVVAKTKAETLKEVEDRETARKTEQAQFQTFIEGELEELEDEYNVDLTSDAPAARKARREFLEMIQTLSPKDDAGTITGYADFDATWKLYQEKRSATKTDASKNKDLASRTMTRPGDTATETEKPRTPGFFGWQKDLGI